MWKFLVPAMLLATAAHGQDRIPQDTLREHMTACVSVCERDRPYAYCAEMCSCVSGEMDRHWTVQEYGARVGKLQADKRDRSVVDELERIADYCAKRILTGTRP